MKLSTDLATEAKRTELSTDLATEAKRTDDRYDGYGRFNE